MSDVAIGEVQHFPLGVSDDIAQGLIDFQPAAIGGCQRHADGGIVECAVDACLEALPPRPRGGGGGGGARVGRAPAAPRPRPPPAGGGGGGVRAPLERLRLWPSARPSFPLTLPIVVTI